MDNLETLSFVIFQDLSEDAVWRYASDSVKDLLGWSPEELLGTTFYNIVHPDEVDAARNLHYEHIQDDKAATLTYLRLLHKGEDKYALCAFSRSVAHEFIVGAISLAVDDPGNARAAMARGGVFVLTPEAEHLSFRNWNRRVQLSNNIFTGSPNSYTIPIEDLHTSDRVCLLLDRFNSAANVLHCTNDVIIKADMITFKNLFQSIPSETDQASLGNAIHVVKNWRTHFDGKADGIFAVCRFNMEVSKEPVTLKQVEGILAATSDAVILVLKPA
ncbi:hypothetical protein FRC19_009406 [Serendipita sp. 401]|nr:hypothetical protein FRC19_009406 [Serendipita sp. 401]KAG9055975.1 hypothetical protein FS842_000650 [Serendipita sp. 407]